jgi:hypothetical protein
MKGEAMSRFAGDGGCSATAAHHRAFDTAGRLTGTVPVLAARMSAQRD